MLEGFGARTGLALAVTLAGSAIVLAMTWQPEAALASGIIAAVAALVAAGASGEGEIDARPPPSPAAPAHPPGTFPPLEPVLEAIVEPLLLVAGTRVEFANDAARTLLGAHIVGQDVRLAIRHPAAAERLTGTASSTDEAIQLVGLGTHDQRWDLRVASTGDGQRLVHLINLTGSYAADRIRVDFVANASHELRTPLAAILGFCETLREGAGEEPATRDRFLSVMEDEAKRMQRLVNDLISLSRIEAEKYRLPETSVPLAALIQEVRAELTAADGARAADLAFSLGEDVPEVTGDRAQLSQLLHNVIGNALKYGRAGTPVTVSLRRVHGQMVKLSVRDQGEGIAPEHLPRLTERFYRVDSGRSRALGGTGLGLAIVKHIVERHRGRLEIASTPGQGTLVSVLLPPRAGVPADASSRPALSSKRNATGTQGNATGTVANGRSPAT